MTDFQPDTTAPEMPGLPVNRRPGPASAEAVVPGVPGASIAAQADASADASADAAQPELPGDDLDATLSQLEGASEIVGFGGLGAKLNWLRAGVLGANDGVVSGAGITIGVAVADPANIAAIMLAGVAGLLAGASAMAMGEYVSVSSQRDTEEALIAQERHDLRHTPEEEFEELVEVYRGQGLSEGTAR